MAEIAGMAAQRRTAIGTGAARACRRTGNVPGIVYGTSEAPMAIAIDQKTFSLAFRDPGFFSRLYDLDVDGTKVRALPRDVQVHPVKDTPLHVDFLRLTADSRVNVEVAVHFANEEAAPGLKRGGVLNIVRHTVELNCRADSIPEAIEIDLTGHDIGDSIHISAVALPDGVQPTITDRDFTIATVAAPTVVHEAEETAEEEEGIETEAEAEADGAATEDESE